MDGNGSEFLQNVREYSAGPNAGRDFGNDQQARDNVKAVISVLKKYIPEGEFRDIRAELAESIASLFENTPASK